MERVVTLRLFRSFDDMKTDSYRYWQEQPEFARLEAVSELNAELYALKGIPGDAPRLQRIVRILER
jgi:hypothetical protein